MMTTKKNSRSQCQLKRLEGDPVTKRWEASSQMTTNFSLICEFGSYLDLVRLELHFKIILR